MLVLGQPFEGGRDGLRDGVGRIGDPAQMYGQPVEEAARGVHGGRDQQRIGAGEVAVHRLASDAEGAGDVTDRKFGATCVDRLARRVEDAADGLLVGGGCRSGPAVGAHPADSTSQPPNETGSALTPLIHPDLSRCGSSSLAMFGI